MEKIAITEQTCLLEEKFSKNGVQKNVHVVVKNNPFVLTIALLDKQLNFNEMSADIQLVYDCASLKEVDFVKLKPMDFKAKANEEGDQLGIEIRIKVLTSQLEDMFFRVKVTLVDSRTHKEISHLMVLSHPIRVVSKPDQVKKKIKKRKRAPTDNLMDTLHRIEVQQKEQQRLLKRLCVNPTTTDAPGDNAGESSQDLPVDGFHVAFTEFLAAFKQLSSFDDGSYKVNTSTQDAQTMCEILDLIRAELSKPNRAPDSPPRPAAITSIPCSSASEIPPCACSNCPYRESVSKSERPNLQIFSIPEDSGSNCDIVLPGSQTHCFPQASIDGIAPHMPNYSYSFSDLGSIFAMQ